MNDVPDILTAALALRSAGIGILPIDHTTKRPDMRLLPRDAAGKPVWEPLQFRIADEPTVRGWFAAGKARSIAIVGGAVSGHLLVIDFDVARLYDTWRELVGELADGLPLARTGGGGYHIYLRCPQPGRNVALAYVRDESEESGRTIGIETRGEGGYAVVAPSLHPSGARYTMLAGDLTAVPTISQARADALLAAARKLDEAPYTRQEQERIERDAVRAHERRASINRNGDADVIGQFNQAHGIESVLEHSGYTRCGSRFVRPGGESTSVSIRDGRSFHFSSDDPLNDGRVKSGMGVHDAFDI